MQFLRFILLILPFLIIFTVPIHGQQGNPFELEHKVPEAQKWRELEEVNLPSPIEASDTLDNEISAAEKSIYVVQQIEGNPFNINSSPLDKMEDDIQEVAAVKPIPQQRETHLNKSAGAKLNQFKIIMVILLLIALALISTLLRHVIIKVFESFQSDNLLRGYFRSTGRRIGLPNLLLEVFFIVNAAFAIFLIMESYQLVGNSPVTTFLQILLATGVIVFGKHLILYILQEVFPVQKQASEYNFTINVFFSILGLILLPCNLILAFAPVAMAKLGLYFVVIVTTLVLGYLAFRAFLIGSKFLGSNRFHFFMYLCTVEIAPTLIIIKVLKNYMGS